MPNENQNGKKYDLEERTAIFGENVIEFCKKIPRNPITLPLITQLIKSSTSIGANYCEADCAETKKDFVHKIGICKKESKETRHWTRMIAKASPDLKNDCHLYWQEANELNLIFSSIINKSNINKI